MSSSIDQMLDQIDRVSHGQPAPARVTVQYAFVIKVGGNAWREGTFEGNASGCISHMEKTYGVTLGDAGVRWARGHLDRDGNFKIHPANDRDAVERLQAILQPSGKR